MICKLLAAIGGDKHTPLDDFIPEFGIMPGINAPTMDVDVLKAQLSAFGRELNAANSKK